ncbi:hypothetical protein CICLE_v10017262mg [Citrus x clementina]|uniref:Uncharacterized protein n=1 Tax=Citrus clementina TaxID=85681 RepID=V4W2Z4_CITCL|nr:hypothetical protein CICLE_v10017262mg [Citrus x clementina]
MKEQEKVSPKAKKIVKWEKQVSMRISEHYRVAISIMVLLYLFCYIKKDGYRIGTLRLLCELPLCSFAYPSLHAFIISSFYFSSFNISLVHHSSRERVLSEWLFWMFL